MKTVLELEFLAEPFLRYASTMRGNLMQLIEEAEILETNMALVNTISVIVGEMNHRVCAFSCAS